MPTGCPPDGDELGTGPLTARLLAAGLLGGGVLAGVLEGFLAGGGLGLDDGAGGASKN